MPMLWFASRLLSSIFSLAPNRSGKTVTADSTLYHTISASSSFTTLVDDEIPDYQKRGHNAGLKRARSDATLCFSEASNCYDARGAFIDAECTLPPKKRRRGVLETPCTESSHNLRDPYIQGRSFEYVPTDVPLASGETPQTKVQCRRIELNNPSQHAVNCATSLSDSDLRHFSNVRSASLHIVGHAPLDSNSSPPECSDPQGEPPSIPGKQRRREYFIASEESLEPTHLQTDEVAHDVTSSKSDCPSGVHNAASNGICIAHPASSERAPYISGPFNERSPELSSRLAAPEGEATRVEITFERLHNVLLCSPNHDSLIQEAAKSISTGSRWLTVYRAYKETLRWARFYSGAGLRKNRFMDLMNLIVEEAPGCGLNLPYTHQLRYNRYHYDGSVWCPEKCSEEGSSGSGSQASKQNGSCGELGSLESDPCESETLECEPFQDDLMSPCIGTVEGREQPPAKSAWERAAVIVDVYNPSNEDSPRESKVTSVVQKPCERAQDSLPLSRPRRVKGMSYNESEPCPRMSWTELEHDFYCPRKFDTELAANATRLFSATGNRRHVVGVHVCRMKVRFCIYDRAGTIYTTPLDLRGDGQRIIAAFISLSFLDAFSLGLEPFLALKTPASPSRLLQGGINYVIDVDGLRLRTDSLLHAGEVIGRGTTVYSATLVPAQSSDGALSTLGTEMPLHMVVKLSWHTPHSHSEDELLRLAEERGVQGVPRLYRSAVTHRVSEGIRSRLVPAPMYADRELRVQVIGPVARPLYEVADLETFKTAFRSLVKIHYDLFEKAGILHRDISIGNLMVDSSNPSQGVLIDLDFAARVAEHGNPLNGESFPPAGTINFRAFDVLTPHKPAKAYYRHDLESFFYTLLWIQIHYMGGKKLDHPSTTSFDFNFDGTWKTTQTSKKGFLLGACYPEGYQLPPTPLRDQWLAPMRRLFGEALRAKSNAISLHRQGKGALLDEDTFGERLTYGAFARILQR